MIRAFLKDSFFYSFANLFTRGIGFVLLPVYTRVLSKKEYGFFDYLTTVGVVLGVIFTLEITQAIFRYIPECKNNQLKLIELASTGFWFSVGMYLLLCVVFFVFSQQLAVLLLDDVFYSNLIKITAILFFSSAVLYNFTSLMRANLLAKKVVLISMLNAVLVATFSLLLVVYLELGIFGLISGQLLGVTSTSFVAYHVVKKWVRPVFCFESLKRMLIFSTPLVLSSVGVVLSMFVDRIMLKEFLGAEQLASYAVAIKIASIVTLLMVGFQSALTPLIYANYQKEETPHKIATLFHLYISFSFCALVFLGLSAPWIISVVAGPQYLDASNYVAPLVCAALFSSIYLFFPGLNIAKKTFIISLINISAGLVNVVLNYIFIPEFGALGAALCTLFSVFIASLFNAFIAQFFYKIPVNLFFIFLLIAGAAFFLFFVFK